MDTATGQREDAGFALVLKELLSLREDASMSKGSNNRQSFDLVLRELMAEREKAAVEKAVTTERLRQQSELMAEREKAANAIRLQQNDFQLRLQKREHQVQLGEHQESLEQDRRVELEQQDRQHTFFREVIQQLQEEVKLLRQSGESGKSALSILSFNHPRS